MLDFIKNISPVELGILAAIIIIFFGAKGIANLGKTGGQTVKEIKNIKKEITNAVNDEPEQKS